MSFLLQFVNDSVPMSYVIYTVSAMLQFAYLALQRDNLKEKCLFDWKDVALVWRHMLRTIYKDNVTFPEKPRQMVIVK